MTEILLTVIIILLIINIVIALTKKDVYKRQLLNRKLISLPEQTNTILKYMRRLPKISRCFRTRAGWCKTEKKIIMYMHKP